MAARAQNFEKRSRLCFEHYVNSVYIYRNLRICVKTCKKRVVYARAHNYEEADESFNEALRICERDPKWPRDSMRKIIEAIHKEIELKHKLPSRKSR